MRSNRQPGIEERSISAKIPAWQIIIAAILLVAYAVALWLALWFSAYWLVWVLVALGMGSGIPILLLSLVSFAGWMHREARANGLNDMEAAELGMTAAGGCLWVFSVILELFSHW